MPVSKAQQKAVTKYMRENYDVYQMRMPKGEREKIRLAAADAGQSMNAYILEAVRRRMEQESK